MRKSYSKIYNILVKMSANYNFQAIYFERESKKCEKKVKVSDVGTFNNM